MIARLFVSLILVATSDPALSAEPRQPTGAWTVDFDEAQCVAYRNYGTKDEPLFLTFKAPPLGNVMQVMVLRPGQPRQFAYQLEAKVGIDGRTPIRTSMLVVPVNDRKQRLFRINLTPEDFAPIRTAKTISIRGGSELREEFSLDQMGPLLKVVDDCVVDLRRAWNVVEGDAPSPNLKERASGDLQRIFSADDYPGIAVQRLQDGRVRFALLIDEQGKIADCTVIESSGVAVLDAQSCTVVMGRARFQPAIGLDGKPAKDAIVQSVRWQIR